MLTQTSQYKTLDYCISKVKLDLEILNTSQDIRLRNFAVDTFRDMNMVGTLPTIQTAILKIHNGVAYFPDDYEMYYKIGIHHCGRILNLTLNDDIALVPRSECHVTQEQFECGVKNIDFVPTLPGITSVDGNWQGGDWGWLNWGQYWNFAPGFHNGQYVEGFFGHGAGVYRGGYRVDEQNRCLRVEMRHCEGKEIIMEYRSNGGIDSGNAYVPAKATDCLCYGMKVRLCENSINPVWERKQAGFQQKYNNRLKRLTWSQRGFTPTEALQTIRESIHQLPKR